MSHRSIPCPKCDRIWLWVEDKDRKKAFCPDGYGCADETHQQNDIVEKLDDISDRLDNLERDVSWIVQHLRSAKIQPQIATDSCSVCGMLWTGTMGYVCLNQNCPVQMKITC